MENETKKIMEQVYKNGLNIYALINRLKKQCKIPKDFPDEVIIEVCKEYQRYKKSIGNQWAWFTRVMVVKSREYFANKNIEESKKWDKRDTTFKIGDLFK